MPLTEVQSWVVTQVATSIIHNWPFLLLGVLSAAALKVYLGTDRLARCSAVAPATQWQVLWGLAS